MNYEFRSPVYSSNDGQQIDMEINHPSLGWIPYTARPDATEQRNRDMYAAALLGEVGEYGEPEPPDSSAVNKERDRRIAAGTTISVSGYGVIPMTGTDRDMTLITAMLIRARDAHADGAASASMVLRDRDNVIHNLTPLQMLELTSKGMQWVEDTMTVSWAMKDGTAPFEGGIPLDFTDDGYWP
jgi:hypothetical protein